MLLPAPACSRPQCGRADQAGAPTNPHRLLKARSSAAVFRPPQPLLQTAWLATSSSNLLLPR
eukprot:2365710-Pleurochrysis_carterae.AAC.2